jgi:hypothetical protein
MDLCSLCHSGVGHAHAPTLSYRAGESLAKVLTFDRPSSDAAIDPHGSQALTLGQSRCFQQSAELTCVTCHDVHKTQRDITVAAASCLKCHEPQRCGKFASMGEGIRSRCVACHMPLQETEKIIMRINGEKHKPKVRTHRIAIYAEDGPQ